MASVQTKVIWATPIADKVELINAELASMANLETQPSTNEPGPGANEVTVYRYWIDLASATEWINYVTTLNPILATIVE